MADAQPQLPPFEFKNRCCFFSLRLSCMLIAIMEAVSGALQIFCTDALCPLDESCNDAHGYMFDLIMGSATLVASALLYIGAVLENSICVGAWIWYYIVGFIVIIYRALVISTTSVLPIQILCLCLEVFLFYVVARYWFELRMKPKPNTKEENRSNYAASFV